MNIVDAQIPSRRETLVGLESSGQGGWINGPNGNYHVIGVLVTSADTIITYSDYRRVAIDGGESDVVIAIKINGEQYWETTLVISADATANNLFINIIEIDNLTTNKKELLLFYAERPARANKYSSFINETKLYFYKSEDEGRTWTNKGDLAPILETADRHIANDIQQGNAPCGFVGEDHNLYARKAFFPGPGNVIQLSSNHPVAPNRIVVPILALKERGATTYEEKGYGNAILYSNNGGDTWEASIIPIGSKSIHNFTYPTSTANSNSSTGNINYYNNNEACVVELANGDLLLNARTVDVIHPNGTGAPWNYRRSKSISQDGGLTWTTPTAFPNEHLPPYVDTHSGLTRYSKSPNQINRLLFSHPNNEFNGSKLSSSRKKMTVRLSYDEHDNWKLSREIYNDSSHYSNMVVSGDDIFLIYGKDSSGDYADRIVLERFNLAWLSNRHDDPVLGRAIEKSNWTIVNPVAPNNAWTPFYGRYLQSTAIGVGSESLVEYSLGTISTMTRPQHARLYLKIPADTGYQGNWSEEVRVTVHHAGGQKEIPINQKVSHGLWMHLGEFRILGSKVTLSNIEVGGNAGSTIIAGQVAFELV